MLSSIKKKDTENTKDEKPIPVGLKKLGSSLVAVISAFILGIALMMITGNVLNIPDFFAALFNRSFGSLVSFGDFLGKLSWMIPLGLSLAVSFKIGVFNIGSAGQMLGGGLGAYIFASNVQVGPGGWILVLIIGALIGMLIATLIGLLKNSFGIHEVISSIMINWIMFYIFRYCSPSSGASAKAILDGNALRFDWLANAFDTSTVASPINLGIIIVLPIPIILFILYKYSLWGYKQELIGNNKNVGKYLGVNEKWEILKAFMISGALAGLAGAIYYVGYRGDLPQSNISDIPADTFLGITISLIGFNSPLGIFASSALISMLTFSSNSLDSTIGSHHVVDIIVAVMIIFMAMTNLYINYKDFKFKKPKINFKKWGGK